MSAKLFEIVIRFRLLKQFLFLLVLFTSFHLLYDVVYENHLGEGTDSDVFYPYLFARDVWTGGLTGIRGWNLPPCTYLFPEILIAILLFPLVPSVYGFHLVFGFISFVLPYSFAKQLGMPKRYSYLVALEFLVLAGFDPNLLGQFYLPGFHAMIFFFATWTLVLLEQWKQTNGKVWFPFLFLMTMVWVSEYWFFVNIAPFLICYAVVHLRWKSLGPISIGLLGLVLAKSIAKGLRFFGIGIIGTDNLQLLSKLNSTFHTFVLNPSDVWQGLVHSISKHPLLSEWFQWYLLIGIIYLFIALVRDHKKDFFLTLILFLSPFITVIFLFLIETELNIRYLYFLPFGIIFFSSRILERIPLFRFGIPIVLVIGCFLFYIGKHSELVAKVKAGEEKRKHRMECLSEFDPKIPGAATYWPIKYSYVFSNIQWTLVPFTKDGVYYPWIANTSWDGDFKNQSFDSFPWGVTENKENLKDWKDVTITKECEGWYFFRRNEL
ncbi:hypothetical protein ND809_03665 [Leptospira levettii]|uniref:hypothetical protein n=1 Tax=Leptospira levettii TaxID=2023178 RepID=UPI00223DED9B|nr:hypothetical protein [Leptospira levettii]MCW7510491.1 hypothetical protein [Leptospira levettii]